MFSPGSTLQPHTSGSACFESIPAVAGKNRRFAHLHSKKIVFIPYFSK
jgi:hypothetical protein